MIRKYKEMAETYSKRISNNITCNFGELKYMVKIYCSKSYIVKLTLLIWMRL